MEWTKLLDQRRTGERAAPGEEERPGYMRDVGRILFSEPFRRLANKTQVHSLPDNDHLHHRLIHSFEVAHVGRSLGDLIARGLARKRVKLPPDAQAIIPGVVDAACMAHDLGNPPFGHFGEGTIGEWFKENLEHPFFRDLTPVQKDEFRRFEGNAQGFRLLTRRENGMEGGMRLTNATLGAFMKYPITSLASDKARRSDDSYIGARKYGLFADDADAFARVADALGLPKRGEGWARHPLAFVMEAADDICYSLMDLEDAFLVGDLKGGQVLDLMRPIFDQSPEDRERLRTADAAESEHERIARYRAGAINRATLNARDVFIENYDDIMAGRFSTGLLEKSKDKRAFDEIRTISRNAIYGTQKKAAAELYGRGVLYKVLNGFFPIIQELAACDWDLANSNNDAIKKLAEEMDFPNKCAPNAYAATHVLTDFVSGMTDRYAVKIADYLK